MKSKKLRIVAIVAAVIVLAGVVSFSLLNLLSNVLKPQDFNYIDVPSGADTGYYRYAYNELNANERNVYNIVIQNIYGMPEKIEVPALEDGDLLKVFEAISYDNPDLFCLGLTSTMQREGQKVYFIPQYIMTYDEYNARLTNAKNIALSIAQQAKAYPTQYEQELFVHDYLIQHCVYSNDTSNPSVNSMYGCLVEGRASCEGYSRAFQYIMSALNIDNRLVTGEASDDGITFVGHMWNFVVIDGKGYFVDVTWDDPGSENNVLHHTYFNVTTEQILLRHANIKQPIPICTDTESNFFVKEGSVLTQTNSDALKDSLETIILKSKFKGYNCAEIKFNSPEELSWAIDEFFNKGVVYRSYQITGLMAATEANRNVYYSVNEELYTVCMYF
ncbi:MAG: hypothetical protein IKC01_02935 [Clostridia bacterium]|nr:hypothetical protein [Clostridia bacterium]